MRTQFNVRICKQLAKRVATDRRNLLTTNDIVAEVALEDFFTRHTPDEREKFYRAHRRPYVRGAK